MPCDVKKVGLLIRGETQPTCCITKEEVFWILAGLQMLSKLCTQAAVVDPSGCQHLQCRDTTLGPRAVINRLASLWESRHTHPCYHMTLQFLDA